ncbi:glutamyl-tRNA reductase [cf. Phormidesmis sp. LEGE 11477]|uniref:glutamyl-tRNA reductase n=1 Tax=cf. Phormidesmis sp. LEGE 11477 TaxID=1828680 RepID=UPI001882AE9F|nr:glutamyl-tRNA reductase [cf. Phormidesmis sp. LEGE 11477]MBE9060624.1 glutamyl-tRNA reductase [cf. Phormidesmis sp. LEGE 11477]
MNIVMVGLSHKTAPVEVRERLSISSLQIEAAISELCCGPHIQEAAILSTCNRLEVYVAVYTVEQGTEEVIDFLCKQSRLSAPELNEHLFVQQQQAAVRHLMRVAAGLDSLVLGEGQILSQVKHAYRLSQKTKGAKQILNQLFKQAITVAKRVRTETSISQGAISISAAAVELASTKINNLASSQIAVVGAGKMARLLIRHLSAKGVTQLAIVNRSLDRAKALAREVHKTQVTCYPATEMMSVIAKSDLVFTSTAATHPLIERDQLAAALAPYQSLMLIDISVPRNVDSNTSELSGVQVFNVDDLTVVLDQNQENRRQAALEANALINAEIDTFRGWVRSLETVSTISCLREKVESIRDQEVRKALSRLGTEFDQKEIIETLTRRIVNKILHDPMVHLRTQRNQTSYPLTIETVQRLFDLEIEADEQSKSVEQKLKTPASV